MSRSLLHPAVPVGKASAAAIAWRDLVPYRKRAEVLFTGYAYAPSGSSVESMTVRLRAGP